MASVTTDRRFGVNSNMAIKVPCKVASTGNLTLSGEQTIDGVSVTDGDRVLAKNQTDASENGIYRVQTTSWVRAPDWDGSYDVVQGTLIPVNSGTVNADSIWRVTTSGTITVGTTEVTITVAALGSDGTTIDTVVSDISVAGSTPRYLDARLLEKVHATDFDGVDPTGATDSSTGLQAAINYIESLGGGTLFLPGGDYDIGTGLTITEPVNLEGEGWQTNLFASDAIQMFTISAGVTLNRENNNPGLTIRQIRFNGISPTEEAGAAPWTRALFPNAGGIKFQNVDQVIVEDCYFLNFRKAPLWWDTKCREHLIRRNYFRYNGDLTASEPTIKIVESSTTADSHNQIFFESNSIAYSLGDTVLIDTHDSNALLVRNIHFANNFIHGIVDTIDGLPYDHTGLTNFHHFKVGDCEGLRLFDNSITTAGDDTPCVLFQEGSAANRTRYHQIRGGRMVQHYDITTPGSAPAVKLEGATNGADVTIDGVLFTGHNTIFQDAASTTIRLGLTNVFPTGLNVWEGSQSGTWELLTNYSGPGLDFGGSFNTLTFATNTTTNTVDGQVRWNGENLRIFDGNSTAERSIMLGEVRTAANLGSAAHDANTVGKYQGKSVYTSSSGKVYWAAGSGSTDAWALSDGSGTIAPS